MCCMYIRISVLALCIVRCLDLPARLLCYDNVLFFARYRSCRARARVSVVIDPSCFLLDCPGQFRPYAVCMMYSRCFADLLRISAVIPFSLLRSAVLVERRSFPAI
ncbi:hypothetical protein OE88DRAFT_14440 [Heliocybe sulcata]|uniref:Secreted protein n=1 Tax=Heliocybe sulcata TaxID=5364 RepID=A0A5C3NFA6_9AGAM|nr:hypothetical protein OE88DRAFT_14440 [Heliocybe sulcata]